MEFKTIKPYLRKNLLWMGAVIFSLITISLIVILVLPLTKQNKVIFASQFALNFLIMYFVSFVLNSNRSALTIFTNIETTTDLTTNEVEVTVKKSNFVHIFILLLTIATFFIQLTSGGLILKIGFATYARNNWWVFLIVFVINILYFYLFFSIDVYLLDNSPQFKADYLEFLKEYKSQKAAFEAAQKIEQEKVEPNSEE
ncbi:hypothetical protein [Spiroplasma clarkii]|uniref:Transmembrane protein n=1 Tax=Spiroplasma clarkii TaxID=2139 RepID=A0A2K8KJN8_9MOLU|nr:hypothetical protein [Spiroplasma clarkii]ATX71592.1 hypothetical protein SCLAR_v1c12940 [Spiroplasma clarkii]